MNLRGGGKFCFTLTHEGLYLLEEHVPEMGETYRRIGWVENKQDAVRIVRAMNAVGKEGGGGT